MKYALWIVQVLLGVAFFGAGFTKIITPYADLLANPQMAWVESLQPWMIQVIGVLEVAGALGLILPAVTRILPILTPLAGVGLALTMIGAAILHIVRGEFGPLVPNFVLMALALFVAYGRFTLLPILPRGAEPAEAAA